MNYLLDTHILFWFGEGSLRLPERVRDLVLNPENNILISHASIWEMTIKSTLGKLELHISLAQWERLLQENHFQFLSSTFAHFEILKTLPFYHSDPFDRLLIAQAISEKVTLISHDGRFKSYPVQLELI